MKRGLHITISLFFMSVFFFLVIELSFTQENNYGFNILVPKTDKISTQRTVHHIVGRITNDDIVEIMCSYPFKIEKTISVISKEKKDGFPKEIQTFFPENFVVTEININSEKAGKVIKSKQFKFKEEEKVDLKKFWATIEFREILAIAYNDSVLQVGMEMSGFKIIKTIISKPEYRNKWQNIFVFTVPLRLGLNAVKLVARNASNKYLEEGILHIFSNPVWYKSEVPPENFVTYLFHNNSDYSNCKSCHAMKIEPGTERETSNLFCQQCHKEIYKNKFMHIPVERGMCFECHNPDDMLQVSDTRQGVPLCRYCHSYLLKSEEKNAIVHSPVKEHKCLFCHNAHGSLMNNLINQPILNTCLICHDERYQKNHPLYGHPVISKTDPIDNKKEFNCVSCHKPHAADMKNLLKADVSCKDCHVK